MRGLVASVLESLGFLSATLAATGYEALKLLPRERFDLVVTDINMPELNGLELIRFIRNSPGYEDVPLIIVSSEGSERDQARGLELGASAYLTKPFEPQELVETARRLLGVDRDA